MSLLSSWHIHSNELSFLLSPFTLQMSQMEFISIAGPTYDQQPPFQWSKVDFADTTPHWGHPDIFKFEQIQWDFQWQ